MSCSVTERVSSTTESLPSASTTGATLGSSTAGATSTVSSTASTSRTTRWRERLETDLATSPNSRSTTQGAGTPGGAGPPQNGPQSSSPQESQLRAKPCSAILLCCCCKCPWSNPATKNGGKAKKEPQIEVKVTMEEARKWDESFENVMKSNPGRKIFRNFLKGEYSEENILFWMACEDFKKHADKSNISRKARLIYVNFIHPSTKTEVSLDSRVREQIKKQLGEPQPNMYDEAQLQIYTLMQRDSYPRFINTPFMRSVIQDVNRKPKEKVSFIISRQRTPSLHTIDLEEEPSEEDHGQASQSTPLLTATHPAATTPVSDFSDRDQDGT